MFRFGDPGGRIYTSAGTSMANILAHWTSWNTNLSGAPSTTRWSVSAGNGRTTGSCLRLAPNSNEWFYLTKTLDARQTWGIAFAYKTSILPNSTNTPALVIIFDGTSNQVDLRLNADGTLSITRNGTVLGTSTRSITTNTWNHFELKVKIDPSTGTAELRVNGVAWIGPLTGLNTRATANSTANVIAIGNASQYGTAPNADYDDIIVWDTQTTDANGFTDISDFIGDCGLSWLLPTGAGTTTQFTPDTGSNYARVNEATPDGDTSYVSSSTVGNIDTYAMADLGGTVSGVKSVASILYARKDDVGSRGIKAELRSNSGNTVHTTELSLSNSYLYYFSNWGQNPNNGSPTNWTVAAVNALEAGQIVSS
jgi:hypothetical protein